MVDGEGDERWNHNIHYYDAILAELPPHARTALDVGSGDGLLAAQMVSHVDHVTGIDCDAEVVARAESQWRTITWIVGDIMTAPLPERHYDMVAAVASLHHLDDVDAALVRLAELAAPGGVVMVIGCARSSRIQDYLMDMCSVVAHQFLVRCRDYWEHSAPVVVNFPHTYAEIRDLAAIALPGMRFRRRRFWRYSIVWTKPRTAKLTPLPTSRGR